MVEDKVPRETKKRLSGFDGWERRGDVQVHRMLGIRQQAKCMKLG